MSRKPPVELEFSRKYDQNHSRHYLEKHRTGLARRLSHWREESIGRAALKMAGNPRVVLDLPCGAGRFWPMLAEHPERIIYAADNSADMIATARAAQPPAVVARVARAFQTSAFAIDLEDAAVDCVFCIRLLHHIDRPEHRLIILREFARVSRDTAIVSLWVDGNYKAWRRARIERLRPQPRQNRFVVRRADIEQEFAQAGFTIIGYKDFIPGYSMWRTYVLRKKG